MKFSILISSYNKGKYLKQCLDSCLNQTEKNYEIIVYDNNSTDNTNKILNRFKNYEKIKIFKKKRLCKFPALNQIDLIKKAFKKSKGEIICLLDADDYFNSIKLTFLKKRFNKDPKDIIFDLPIMKYSNYTKKFTIKKKIQKNIWPTIIPTSSISCKRSFFKKFMKENYLNKFQNLEIDFRLNIYSRNLKKNFSIVKNNFTYYRQVSNGIMSDKKKFSKKWWIKRLEAHNYMKKIFKKNKLEYKNKFDFIFTKILSKI